SRDCSDTGQALHAAACLAAKTRTWHRPRPGPHAGKPEAGDVPPVSPRVVEPPPQGGVRLHAAQDQPRGVRFLPRASPRGSHAMNAPYAGKVVVITGAAGGIGTALVERYGQAGAIV